MENQEYIIINKTALEKRIEELEKELAYHNDWYEKARENYNRDRKFWGQADDGEMRVASDASTTTSQEIKILKELLSQSILLIPEIDKAYDAGIKDKELSQMFDNPKGRYVYNLKLDI